MITPIIILITSVFIISVFILRVLTVWIRMQCFWGRVLFRKIDGQKFDIEYEFSVNGYLTICAVFSFAGMLWSVIKLATM